MWFEALNILLLALAIKWVNSIANCDCAKGWRRNFMQFYFSVGIVFQFSLVLGLNRMLNWPMAGLGVMYGFVALNYIKEMKSKLCECATRALQPWFFWLTLSQTAWALVQVMTR
jgi:hypothetical protein